MPAMEDADRRGGPEARSEPQDAQRRLGVLAEPAGFSPMLLAEAARGLCRPVWLVGWAGRPVGPRRVLSRLGDVVDLTGLDDDQAVAAAAAARLDGVVVFNDPPQRLAARIAGALGLPFHDEATAAALSDKGVQRCRLRQGGVPVPRFTTVHPAEAARRGWAPGGEVGFPAVLKPREGAASRDTYRVDSLEELRATLGSCRDEPFILEEFLDTRPGWDPRSAAMVSVESLVLDGRAHHLALTGRFPLAPPFRETGSFLPAAVPDPEPVLAMATAAAAALGARHGALHTEIKLTGAGPRIIEVNGRIGGGIPGLLQRVGGPPLVRLAMRAALGLPVEESALALVPGPPVAFTAWWPAPEGASALAGVDGLDAVRELAGVDEIRLNRQPGEPVDPREGGILGAVVAVDGLVADHAALWELLAGIAGTMRLRYQDRAQSVFAQRRPTTRRDSIPGDSAAGSGHVPPDRACPHRRGRGSEGVEVDRRNRERRT